VRTSSSERGLILAPLGRDAQVAASILEENGVNGKVCRSLGALVAELGAGAGFALVTEEALHAADLNPLAQWIRAQPEWSDFPFVLLTRRGGGIERNPAALRYLSTLGNVTFLERPFHPTSLVSLVQSALRGRRRQYEARARLTALAELNATLEARVDAAIAARLEDRQRLAKTETALRQAQKMEAVGQLTGGVAHDFNNLLMAFSSGMYLLDQPMDAERRRRVVDGMRQAVDRGMALTRQLLTFSRRRPLAPKTVDLREQLLGMHEMLQRSLRGDVEVKMSFGEELWPVDIDPSELELAILNLCVNARDAMPEGGTISISARNSPIAPGAAAADNVIVTVSDTGIGMTQDVLAHAFEPFFTTKEVGRGSGLGLAQVYGFIAQSNGQVTLDSAPGKGTTVSLTFPRSHARLAPEREAPPARRALAGARDRRKRPRGSVLLVEDDGNVAALTGQMLESIGLSVTHAMSAAEALNALAASRKHDIVFSDVMMPGGMSGVELAREIRQKWPGLPVVLTTGYIEAARSAVMEGLEVLVKPYALETLARTLDGHLAKRIALAR
jgi:signal transduction histidine kinase/ActR/RegA family two-component response regulator